MMAIQYTYEIVKVDEAANSMEVVYTANGYPTQHIGMPLPLEGSAVEAVIQYYAPTAFWMNEVTPRVIPQLGATGTLTSADPVVPSADELARQDRQYLLVESDWTQLPDSPLPADKRAAWAQYRQLLRDITTQPEYPTMITWPIKPE